ncbi:DUF262 domain-containing protein [Segatella copri]|uniref:DUF262 domain-containing protein n=1 Tax=Segatella copri TaxID=165179 RepID=UPI0011825165|nr:DUF262 domain-containing protein [Segatella copri]
MENKIDGQGMSVAQVFEDRYVIDYFQREYKWEKKHIEQLIYDLDFAFHESYKDGDTIDDIPNYKPYFMGPYIVSRHHTMYSLIDGQQRLTSLTLLLIYIVKHFPDTRDDLEKLIYKRSFKKESYNLNIEGRERVMDFLFKDVDFDRTNMSVSEINILSRYSDIEDLFPERLRDSDKIILFSYWLLNKVVLVQILSYSDDNAYTIFETMNDRGFNLTSSEMLKSLLLSKIKDAEVRRRCDQKWKENIQRLVSVDKDCEQDFFRAWLRGRYLINVKDTSDIDAIGIGFHRWVKNNMKLFKLTSDSKIESLITDELSFYISIFLSIRVSETSSNGLYTSIFVQNPYGVASSLAYPLYLSVVNQSDLQKDIQEKITLVSKALDTFVVRRILMHQSVGQSSIRGFMYSLILSVRGFAIEDLKDNLTSFLDKYATMGQELKPDVVAHYPYKFLRYFQYRVNLYLESLLGDAQVCGYSDSRHSVLVDMLDERLQLTAGIYRTCYSPIYAVAMVWGSESMAFLKRYRCLVDEPDSKESELLLERLNLPKSKNSKTKLDAFLHSLYDTLVSKIWNI